MQVGLVTILRRCASLILVATAVFAIVSGAATGPTRIAYGAPGQNIQLYFHARRLRTDLSLFGVAESEMIYEQADASSPTGTSITVTLSSNIQLASLARLGIQIGSQNGYFAYVAWLFSTPPNLQVNGDITINVWMSSNEDPGLASAYFFAIADVDPTKLLNAFSNLGYNYRASFGKILDATPSLRSTDDFGKPLHITNHLFSPGRMLLFIAGAGSTKPGWHFNIYFDGSNNPSSAMVPSTLLATQSSSTIISTVTAVPTSSTSSISTTLTTTPGCSISVSLSAEPTSGQVPVTVTFYATVTGANGQVQYDWWFGDGSHITGKSVESYTYQNPWNYYVYVNVLDAHGCWSQANTAIFVGSGPVPEFPSGSLVVVVLALVALCIRMFDRRPTSARLNVPSS